MDRILVIFLHRGTTNIAVRVNISPEIPHENRLAKPVAIATYSASVDESVTNFYVLEQTDTQAPSHVIAPPKTDLRPLASCA